MAKTFREKPAPGKVERAMARAGNERAKRERRHQLVAEAAASLDTWTADDVTFTVMHTPAHYAPQVAANGCVSVYVLALTADGEVIPGLDNPYLFDRPPIKVTDGTWRKETVTQPDGATVDVDVPNMVEDPAGALRQVITQVVLSQARLHGWVG
jgi:hypothetical protein